MILDEAAAELRTMLDELTTRHRHREHYSRRVGQTMFLGDHVTEVPSLLHQLQHAAPSGEGLGRSGAYESRPVARVEALDMLIRVDLAASRWVRDLGEDDPGDTVEVVRRTPAPAGPACAQCVHGSCAAIRLGEYVETRPIPGSGTIACIRLLGGLLASAERCDRRKPKRSTSGEVTCCTWHAVATDVRRWWVQARIVTGWDEAPWRPDNTCPVCAVRGSLRIRLEDRTGLCVECHEVWDPTSYQQLGAHIREESMERRRQSAVGPCVCPWPRVTWPTAAPEGVVGLCPRCGSSTCRYAVRMLRRKVAS